MKIKLTIEIDMDDDVYSSDVDDILWLENEILIGDGSLILHSNEIGDTLGVVKKVSNIRYITDNPY